MNEALKPLYHTHITSKRRWFDLNLKEVWQYRDLIVLFTNRSFKLTYKQTVLGPIWIFLNPFITSVIHTLIFGGIAGISTDGVPKILFYLSSNAIWAFFAACINNNAQTFTANAHVFGKVYFPRLTIPISNVLSASIRFCIQMLMVGGFLAYYVITGEVHPHWEAWPLIPLVLVHLGVMGLGFGIIISSMTTKYRDLISIADTYSKMTEYKLIFTKLDETTTLGNLLNLRLHTGAPLSYVTCGQNVPDDIENFNPQKTVKQLLGGRKN